ncbi:hypothetical protein DUNSADRAFT_12112 [Dunaliella salina]|uniref:Uncharacterized protein n=1 Tax=Dunaliella salina TaxID=3046 RepID=A0ABQ7GC00_DUNSA|nr:hypothetical protein DUNSADRAFT_12112 [Dunaliella salina]|eukprot:KAF5832130.1 hypothetical protein DUNSADRAFT_12112 [Dunaliella salina]
MLSAWHIDNSCICLGTHSLGVVVYCIDSHSCIHTHNVGSSVSLGQMAFRTSLLAYVGSGAQPSLTPRKLTIANTSDGSVLQDFNYTTRVLAVHISKQRLVAVLQSRAFVYELHTLDLLRTIDTPANPLGTSCLSCSLEGGSLLALPIHPACGTVRVYNLMKNGGDVLAEVAAHKTELAVLALPQGTKAFTFRRGTYPAAIHDLAFSPEGHEPSLLCASSSHGTIHVFRLEDPSCTALVCGSTHSRNPAAVAAASAANGILSAVMQVSPMPDMVDPPRSIANLKLPPSCQGAPATCRVLPKAKRHGSCVEVIILVATLTGHLYEYKLLELQNAEGPKCFLAAQWSMLPPKM